MTFLAGQKLRASELNAVIPIFGVVAADQTKTSNTTLADVTGLSVAVEADSTYALDGHIAYDAGATGDLKMAFTSPTGTTGSWGLYGLGTSTTGSVGDVDGHRIDGFTASDTATAGGSASFSGFMVAPIRGVVITDSTAGTLQMQFAQNTSNGTSTIIKVGSWIRIVKIA